jgi:hypothetical protein
MAIGSHGINSSQFRSIPFLPSFPSLVLFAWSFSLGFISWVYLLVRTRWQSLALLSWSLIAGIDGRAERFFQKVSPLGVSGIPYGCKACGHGKKKMRNYFHLFEEKLWTNPARLVGCSCRQQTRRRKRKLKTKMKTKEKKGIKSAIQLPSGLWFTSKRDFAETLFHPLDGKTAFGFYTFHESKKHGTRSIRLRKGNGEIFAVILSNGWNAAARTAWEKGGKIFNLYGLTDEGRKLIGTEETQEWINIIERVSALQSKA